MTVLTVGMAVCGMENFHCNISNVTVQVFSTSQSIPTARTAINHISYQWGVGTADPMLCISLPSEEVGHPHICLTEMLEVTRESEGTKFYPVAMFGVRKRH